MKSLDGGFFWSSTNTSLHLKLITEDTGAGYRVCSYRVILLYLICCNKIERARKFQQWTYSQSLLRNISFQPLFPWTKQWINLVFKQLISPFIMLIHILQCSSLPPEMDRRVHVRPGTLRRKWKCNGYWARFCSSKFLGIRQNLACWTKVHVDFQLWRRTWWGRPSSWSWSCWRATPEVTWSRWTSIEAIRVNFNLACSITEKEIERKVFPSGKWSLKAVP